jgi:hypothetical protein
MAGVKVVVTNLEELEGLEVGTIITSVSAGVASALAQPARRFRNVALIAAAAGNYAAADVVSQDVNDTFGLPNLVPNVVDAAGQVALLDSISATCTEDSIVFRLRLHFYNYAPLPADVEMDDNIAADWAKISAGREGYIGYADLPAFADRGTAMSHSQAPNLRQFLPTEDFDDVWFVVEALDAEANEAAGMRFDFTFGFLN